MTEQEVIEALNALSGNDAEADHQAADKLLMEFLPPAVRDAYERVQDRADGFWYA